MKLPNGDRAEAGLDKVRNYLLNPDHPANRGKAAGFALFGFSRIHWEAFQSALLAHAGTAQVVKIVSTPLGATYVMDGMLEGADGRKPWIRTVWELKADDRAPRLVTAHLIPPPKERST